MIKRDIKYCDNCGYQSIEFVTNATPVSHVDKCVCPQCGGKNCDHLMYIDKRNLPDEQGVKSE